MSTRSSGASVGDAASGGTTKEQPGARNRSRTARSRPPRRRSRRRVCRTEARDEWPGLRGRVPRARETPVRPQAPAGALGKNLVGVARQRLGHPADLVVGLAGEAARTPPALAWPARSQSRIRQCCSTGSWSSSSLQSLISRSTSSGSIARAGLFDRLSDHVLELAAGEVRNQILRGAHRLRQAVEIGAVADEVRAHGDEDMHVLRGGAGRRRAGSARTASLRRARAPPRRSRGEARGPARPNRNSSSNWSTTRSSARPPRPPASSSALSKLKLDWRSVQSMRSRRRAASSGLSLSARLARAAASRLIGAPPGRMARKAQLGPL